MCVFLLPLLSYREGTVFKGLTMLKFRKGNNICDLLLLEFTVSEYILAILYKDTKEKEINHLQTFQEAIHKIFKKLFLQVRD